MKKTYLVANFKANKTPAQTLRWIKTVKPGLPRRRKPSTVINIVCPSFLHLHLFQTKFPRQILGVQDISRFSDGAYTGQTTARMLEGVVNYVILGHSERRRYFHETNQTVALKVEQALTYQITPIVAVDQKNLITQLNQFSVQALEKIIVMYEPPEAISRMIGPLGIGKPAPLKSVKQAVAQIREIAPQSPVLYGGSVKSATLPPFLKQPWLNGVVVGSASLRASEWLKIVRLTHEIIKT